MLGICFLFDEVIADRRSVFSRLFAASTSWMGRPSEFMLLRIKTGAMSLGRWPLPDSVAQQGMGQDLLTVYSDWQADPFRFRSCITLQEANRRAVFTLAFPSVLLHGEAIDDVERQFFHVYEVAASAGKCGTLIGPELEQDPAPSIREAIRSAFDPASLAAWIITPRDFLPSDVQPFSVVKNDKLAAMLRHPDAARRVGL